MLTAVELRLNRMAQGQLSEAAGSEWFEALSAHEREEVLRVLAFVCKQAHPRPPEVPLAIARSGLKPTFTPCVLLAKAERPSQAVDRIVALPPPEQVKSFRLLASLFAVADARRRATDCRDGCTHEWHHLPPE